MGDFRAAVDMGKVMGARGLLCEGLYMPKIKFSHTYSKLLDGYNDLIESAVLLCVYEIDLEHQHPLFLAYDTDNGLFPLPKKGKYIMLLFKKPLKTGAVDENLFTTLRRYTSQKYDYYYDLVGKEFEIVLDI